MNFNNFITIIPTEKQNYRNWESRIRKLRLFANIVYITDSKYECQSEIDFTLNI